MEKPKSSNWANTEDETQVSHCCYCFLLYKYGRLVNIMNIIQLDLSLFNGDNKKINNLNVMNSNISLDMSSEVSIT